MSKRNPRLTDLPDDLLAVWDVEHVTKLSSRTLRRLVAEKLMPAPFKVGAQNRWSRRAIESWLAAGCPPTAQEGRDVS